MAKLYRYRYKDTTVDLCPLHQPVPGIREIDDMVDDINACPDCGDFEDIDPDAPDSGDAEF